MANTRAIKKNGQTVAWLATAGKINGRKMRKRFSVIKFETEEKAKRAAQSWAKSKAKQINSQRSFGALMDERLLSQVSEAVDLLSPYDVRLIDCVREWVRNKEAAPKLPDAPWRFRDASAAMLRHRRDKGLSADYLDDLKISFNAFEQEFGDEILDQITTPHIEGWLDGRGVEPATRGNWRRDLSMVWRFAMLRGHCARNPATLLARPNRREDDVQILKVDQVEKLFRALESLEKPIKSDAITFAAIACFAGLRTSEIARLTSDCVNLSCKELDIRARGRTRRRRAVTIPENLIAWLNRFMINAASPITVTVKTLRKCFPESVPLSHNVLRHSWFSYHLALHQDEAFTQLQGGHANGDLLYRNYRALVTKEEAVRYFSIFPL